VETKAKSLSLLRNLACSRNDAKIIVASADCGLLGELVGILSHKHTTDHTASSSGSSSSSGNSSSDNANTDLGDDDRLTVRVLKLLWAVSAVEETVPLLCAPEWRLINVLLRILQDGGHKTGTLAIHILANVTGDVDNQVELISGGVDLVHILVQYVVSDDRDVRSSALALLQTIVPAVENIDDTLTTTSTSLTSGPLLPAILEALKRDQESESGDDATTIATLTILHRLSKFDECSAQLADPSFGLLSILLPVISPAKGHSIQAKESKEGKGNNENKKGKRNIEVRCWCLSLLESLARNKANISYLTMPSLNPVKVLMRIVRDPAEDEKIKTDAFGILLVLASKESLEWLVNMQEIGSLACMIAAARDAKSGSTRCAALELVLKAVSHNGNTGVSLAVEAGLLGALAQILHTDYGKVRVRALRVLSSITATPQGKEIFATSPSLPPGLLRTVHEIASSEDGEAQALAISILDCL
jgi:hypothetical protein